MDFAITLLIATLSTFGLADDGAARGSGPARISCRSAAGVRPPVTLTGVIPATEEDLDLVLRQGTAQLAMRYDPDTPYVVEDFDHGVFTLYVARRDGRNLTLYALPQTVRVRRQAHATNARFEAVLSNAPRPGHAHGMIGGNRLACTYEHDDG